MGEMDRIGDLLPPQASGRTAKIRGQGGAASGTSADTAAAAADAATASEEDLARRVADVWAEEMGPEIAANARPVQLRDSRLVVTTSSSAWAQTLQLMSPMVAERLNRRLGEGSVERAVFRHAGWDPVWSTAHAGGAGEGGACAEEASSAVRPLVETGASPEASARDASMTLSAEEKRALDEVDRLLLPPAVRSAIRRAMIADFVRDRQESGRS